MKKHTITNDSVKKQMEELGTYRPEFDDIIGLYVEMFIRYNQLFETWVSMGCPYETESESGGTKRSPLVQTLDSMQKNIGSFADRLGLNPRAINTLKTKERDVSQFDKTLQLLSGDLNAKKKTKLTKQQTNCK